LASPGVTSFDRLLLVVSGVPEAAGVWSHELLSLDRVEESSMRNYFLMTQKNNWAMLVLNPHAEGEANRQAYRRHLDATLGFLALEESRRLIKILGFSAGGTVVTEYLNQKPHVAERIDSLILVDPVAPTLKKSTISHELRDLLDRSVLYGMKDTADTPAPWAALAGSILGIPVNTVEAQLHGELPHRLLGEVEATLTAEAH
jgi:pimeloyl-ACP methyl ester carboxylesterase